MTNRDLIERARASLEGVTEGPWLHSSGDDGWEVQVKGSYAWIASLADDDQALASAVFIAESRTLVPNLLDALERAEAECERLRAFVRDEIGHMDTWDRKGLARRWRAALDGMEAAHGE